MGYALEVRALNLGGAARQSQASASTSRLVVRLESAMSTASMSHGDYVCRAFLSYLIHQLHSLSYARDMQHSSQQHGQIMHFQKYLSEDG